MTGVAPAQVHTLAGAARGWLSRAEGDLLYTLARHCRAGVIVEIGAYEGRSTTYLASGSEAGAQVPLFSIDPHDDCGSGHNSLPAFQQQLERMKLPAIVQPIVAASYDASATFHNPIGLLFIDGAHDDTSVRLDWDQWVSKVVPGGYVAMHDTVRWRAPREIAEQRILRSRAFVRTGVIDSITFGMKRAADEPEQPFSERFRILMLKRICNLSALVPLPESARNVGSRILRSLQS